MSVVCLCSILCKNILWIASFCTPHVWMLFVVTLVRTCVPTVPPPPSVVRGPWGIVMSLLCLYGTLVQEWVSTVPSCRVLYGTLVLVGIASYRIMHDGLLQMPIVRTVPLPGGRASPAFENCNQQSKQKQKQTCLFLLIHLWTWSHDILLLTDKIWSLVPRKAYLVFDGNTFFKLAQNISSPCILHDFLFAIGIK